MSSFLVNMIFISICLPLLIDLNSTSESSNDYIDNLRSKHVTATVFLSHIMLYLYTLFYKKLRPGLVLKVSLNFL